MNASSVAYVLGCREISIYTLVDCLDIYLTVKNRHLNFIYVFANSMLPIIGFIQVHEGMDSDCVSTANRYNIRWV